MRRPKPAPGPPVSINGWHTGPILGNTNYTKGVALQALPGGVLQFDLPVGAEIDALCKPFSALPASLTVNYELIGNVRPSQSTTEPALISVAFQRKGDNWSGSGVYQQYRWYTQAAQILVPGAHQFTADFTSLDWSDVYGKPASANLNAFEAAKANVETIYIAFGFSAGRMHGILGPAHFNLVGLGA